MDQIEQFLAECHRRHNVIDTKLDAIAGKLDSLSSPLVTRVEAVERLIWWQRIILLLACIIVSYHPVAGAIISKVVQHP